MRRIAGTECGDAGVHGVGIATLEGRNDFVIRLAGVEVFRELVDDVVVAAGHGVPPLELDRRLRGGGGKSQCGGDCGSSAELSKSQSHQIPPGWTVIIVVAR